MGASGAGKTSLLNILSKRISEGPTSKLNDEMYFNDNIEVTEENFGVVSAYVMQDDILFQHFSPREALLFAAKLKRADLTP